MAATKTVPQKATVHKTRLETAPEETESESPRLLVPVDPDRDHIQGPLTAAITLVEYGDYQCPYCRTAYPEVKKVQKELGSRLKFAFRNFPLTRLHEHAMNAAETAEAAAAQGKFWEMHDFLYEHQGTLGDPSVALEHVKKLGMNTQRFEQALAHHSYQARVKEDFQGGIRSGVNGTPTFYVNGVRHDGPATSKELVKALKQ
jgi:protein-disulfide isomerase